MRADVFLTSRELAQSLRVNRDTILRWTRQGRIPCLRGSQKPLLYDLRAVLAALEQRGRVRVRAPQGGFGGER